MNLVRLVPGLYYTNNTYFRIFSRGTSLELSVSLADSRLTAVKYFTADDVSCALGGEAPLLAVSFKN